MNRKKSSTIHSEIMQLSVTRPHVVILGAGASLAAFPKGDKHGNKLPVMANLVETLSLDAVIEKHGKLYRGENFEALYSSLHLEESSKPLILEIEQTIFDYFQSLELPDKPTLYDYLVLGLREKDVIATFNWDPFLIYAYIRNKDVAPMPSLRFLHGNVAVAFCSEHSSIGSPNTECPLCDKLLAPTKLLYPVEKKDYNSDKFVSQEWSAVQKSINSAYMFTIFGYGAPKTDIEAVSLLKQAWITHKNRELLETEIIDIKSKDDLENQWKEFLFSHHYQVKDSFFKSWIFRHPRRSCEAMWNQTMEAQFIDDNPMPLGVSLKELQDWIRPLVEVERKN